MTTKRKILSKPVFIPMIAGALFAGQLAFGEARWSDERAMTDQVIINMDADTTMVLTQRSSDPSMFGTIADLWDLQFADEQGEISGGTFVTAFRQRDLLILRQVEGDKKVTIDFSAEHAYVDRGYSAVETFSDIELISTDMPFGRARG
ncbi:hypothetical protein N9M21_06235 [Alphaproteobacteria bacterium]|nr:hypothetical protein [Alphaproteobacteria bacterium]